ncbi:beta-galactosidase GalA [Mucilaginibacter sp. BT774]|uniref:beta-galactosidase GalA n=1 Tax=Mucilaginibacter sp. BT774 TaxID=3062276 RepID=UPI0026752D1F|nr:beta-galactosidase GalA [Mucilaginibacter sp. BT774]MDO3627618.1 beta-galactosidase GalA [Mucilaginibacter sp. BT774]
MKKILHVLCTITVIAATGWSQTKQTSGDDSFFLPQRLSLDFGWKFRLGDDLNFEENLINAGVNKGPAGFNFNDNGWRSVNIPHDWAVELPFDKNADASHGYKPIGPGYHSNSIGWYRRSFTLSQTDKEKRLWLQFDGVYRKCQVFLNGYKLTHHEGGYNGFRCDISDVANYNGKNVLAVRVDASEFEGWFYEGAGIYRHVWLLKTAPLAAAPDGIFVYSSFPNNVLRGPATIHFKTKLLNSQDLPAGAKVDWRILGPDGKFIGETGKQETMAAWDTKEITADMKVPSPALWSPESPKLYKLVTTIESQGNVVYRKETEFGIRTIKFDPNLGLLLNGKRYEVRGTCDHQDHAGVGVAVPDALWDFRVRKLKEMGSNAIRTSHNEPAEELVEACDRLGMLIMDETRYFSSDPQSLAHLEQQVCRDRNHPSVFLWSLGNEEPLHKSDQDQAITVAMRRLVHELDPTRVCTVAVYDWPTGKLYGISAATDVQGFNYFDQGETDVFHKNNPQKPSIGTEEGMAQYTRGVYENTSTSLSAYDIQKPDCRHTAEASIKYYAARPWISGMFFWTGFDYRGEEAPFGWPNVSSDFGIMDVCGFPKDVFYYLQSCWTVKPMVHILPHWNWPGKEGKDIDVWAFSNCKEVELFLNGLSLGKKVTPQNSHVQWTVKYQPGTLLAKGYTDGKMVAEEKVETTGAPARIKLTPDRAVIHADGKDLSIVTVAVTDENGRTVPNVANRIDFDLQGPGKIVGIGNGDAISHEPDVMLDTPATRLIPLDNWRIKEVSSIDGLSEVSVNYDDAQWQQVDVRNEAGTLKEGAVAVYRAHVVLKPEDLEAEHHTINFAMIDDEGWVYVNGKLAGKAHDWRSGQSFEVAKFLKLGDNTIAVVVKNQSGPGGISKGVSMELIKKHQPVIWHRSVFNGYAQVIVQSDKTGGKMRLTASGNGLRGQDIIIGTSADAGHSGVGQ